MIEDTKDKVRRNLVLFCLILIISKYLGIAPLEIAFKAVGIVIKEEYKKNIPVIMIASFGYFIYRFISSDQFQLDMKNLSNSIKSHFTQRLTEFRDALIKKALYSPSDYTGQIKFPSVNDYVCFTADVAILQLTTEFRIGKPAPSLVWQFLGMAEYRTTLRIHHPSSHATPIYAQMFKDGYVIDSSNGAEHQFQLNLEIFYPWKMKLSCFLSGVRKAFFSQEFSEAIIPLLLILWAIISSQIWIN